VAFQGITQYGKLSWSSREKATKQVINLRGIDGEEGEAGMKSFPTLRLGALNHTH
jgi:hypothetical protein